MAKTRRKQQTRQAGVVAYRQVAKDWPIQVCLITNRGGRWGFPKGTIRRSEAPQVGALREAFEEAGIAGDIVSGPFACKEFIRQGKPHSLQMYLMHVTSTTDRWAESDWRRRQWVSIPSAYETIDRSNLHQVLDEAVERMKLLVPNAKICRQA